MRLIPGILICLAACTVKTAEESPLEEEVRGKWEELSLVDGKYVIFYPCEAENFSISWQGDSLLVGWGQEMTMEKILRINTTPDINKRGVDLLAEGPDSGTFHIERVDTMKRASLWWIPGEKKPRLMVRDKFLSEFTVVKEPCDSLLQQ